MSGEIVLRKKGHHHRCYRSRAISHTPPPSTSDSEEEIVSSTRSDVKREASLNSNYGSSDEDHPQTGDCINEDAIVAASADFRDLVDDIRTMACVENSKPWSSSENASNWSLGAHISRRPDLQVVAASADFLEVVDDVPRLGQPATEPAKSLIVKLPATRMLLRREMV